MVYCVLHGEVLCRWFTVFYTVRYYVDGLLCLTR